MDAVLGGQFVGGAVTLQRGQGDLGLEGRRVALALPGHLTPISWTPDRLSGGPVFGVHHRAANPTLASSNWLFWVQPCHAADRDCLIGKIGQKFYAFRYVPPK